MPALNGETISTIRDGTGATLIAVVFFYNPADHLLRNDVYTTVQDGIKTGALIADNVTTKAITVRIADDANGVARTVSVPAHGAAFTVAQLAGQGITKLEDLNGLTFNLA